MSNEIVQRMYNDDPAASIYTLHILVIKLIISLVINSLWLVSQMLKVIFT